MTSWAQYGVAKNILCLELFHFSSQSPRIGFIAYNVNKVSRGLRETSVLFPVIMRNCVQLKCDVRLVFTSALLYAYVYAPVETRLKYFKKCSQYNVDWWEFISRLSFSSKRAKGALVNAFCFFFPFTTGCVGVRIIPDFKAKAWFCFYQVLYLFEVVFLLLFCKLSQTFEV